MGMLELISLIIVLSAALAYFNIRFLKLPSTIGLMILALVLSLFILMLGAISPLGGFMQNLVLQIDFSGFLLDFMLGFLLFAGALHTDVKKLRRAKWAIIIYATFGILISTVLVAVAVYFLLPVFYQQIDFIYCLLFGALISPTDPIAVLSILKKAGISESIETKITGESLFNDGIGVVVFLSLFSIASQGFDEVSTSHIVILLAEEIVGGISLGLLLGYVGFVMLKKIDHYQTEVLITLAMVMGGISVAPVFHFSGPLAMVVAGLFIGNKGALEAMSEETSDYIHKFWEMVDEIFNAILFVLIGLELLVIPFELSFLYVGLLAIIIVILSRFISLAAPSYIFKLNYEFPKKTFLIMTWGGLRGGISIALALSLASNMERNLIVSVTYIVVLFSIIVQGLTLGKLVKRLK
ncbi:sodium/proton antiporter, CPA1 family [Chryseobacterium soldanellicola]|uniref:Sodium/proton antiporter, CPA1 family n=2 Tax=Chryseobacterium soldanellicola TaxID=311333 RepID=A0A1H1F8H6_9FLAO|nr:sodium/proton antiporter, CPA1 family [Chryseobacterium soldanellicola]